MVSTLVTTTGMILTTTADEATMIDVGPSSTMMITIEGAAAVVGSRDSVMAINVAGVETAGALLVVKMVPTEVVKMVHTEDVKMAHMVVVKMVHMVVVKMVQEAIGMNIVHITVVDPTMISNVVIMEVIICHLEDGHVKIEVTSGRHRQAGVDLHHLVAERDRV